MRHVMALLAALTTMAGGGACRADLIFNFLQHGTGDLKANTETFTTGGSTITVTAYQGITYNGSSSLDSLGTASTKKSNDLYAKNGGSGETGLGLTSDGSGDHEITHGYGILIDFSKVNLKVPYDISFSSVTGKDKGGVFNGTADKHGNYKRVGKVVKDDFAVIEVDPTSKHLTFMVTELKEPTKKDQFPNILLDSITLSAAAAPEPSTLAIAGLGALGLMAYLQWGRRKDKASA